MSDKLSDRQERLIDSFALLAEDREMTLHYLMELGDGLPRLADHQYHAGAKVKGCMSNVWLHSTLKGTHIHYSADSDTRITRGLIALLIEVLSDLPPQEVVRADIYFPTRIGMQGFIGTQRSNGFASMIAHMKAHANVQLSALQQNLPNP